MTLYEDLLGLYNKNPRINESVTRAQWNKSELKSDNCWDIHLEENSKDKWNFGKRDKNSPVSLRVKGTAAK